MSFSSFHKLRPPRTTCVEVENLRPIFPQLNRLCRKIFNISFIFQDWLNPYCEEKNSNVFAWMARNIHFACPVDGATIVMMAKLLEVRFRIITVHGVWDSETTGPETPMIVLVYVGEGKFVRPHVGKFREIVEFILRCDTSCHYM